MIDAICFKTVQRQDHRDYDVARVWIGGIPFSADLVGNTEAVTRRVAEEAGIEISDMRDANALSSI